MNRDYDVVKAEVIAALERNQEYSLESKPIVGPACRLIISKTRLGWIWPPRLLDRTERRVFFDWSEIDYIGYPHTRLLVNSQEVNRVALVRPQGSVGKFNWSELLSQADGGVLIPLTYGGGRWYGLEQTDFLALLQTFHDALGGQRRYGPQDRSWKLLRQ